MSHEASGSSTWATAAVGLGPSKEAVIGLKTEEAAGGEVGLGVVVDNGCSLEQELVDIWLKREHVPGDELCSVAKWSTHLFCGLEVYVLSQLKRVHFRFREVPY